jgi:hypothetical protein
MKKNDRHEWASPELGDFHRLRAERQHRNLVLTHSSKSSSSKAIKFAGLELFREDVSKEIHIYEEKPAVKPMSDFGKTMGPICAFLIFTGLICLSCNTKLELAGIQFLCAISLGAYWTYINRKKNPDELRRTQEAARTNEEELIAKILRCQSLTEANRLAATTPAGRNEKTDDEPLYNLIECLVKEDRTRLAEQLSRRYLELLQ